MIVLKDNCTVDLDALSEALYCIGFDKLHIFSIRNDDDKGDISITSDKGCYIVYLNLTRTSFANFLNTQDSGFLDYNPDSLYILRNGNYLDIKNIFASIHNVDANVGRGGSQKAHVLSPLDLRLSCYMLSMFGYKSLKDLNAFNYITKHRYLCYTDKTGK